MAFTQYVAWNVRNGGSTANGGGFDPVSGTPGTDYSLQDAAQIAYTDLVIDAVTNTNCTSAGNPFTAAHVGNIINITGGTGFTVQRVQIMSVAAGVATCDKSLGTLGSTGGTGNLGGALPSPGFAAGLMVAGNVMHFQYNATPFSATSTSSNVNNGRCTFPAGAIGTPVLMRGYEVTPYDEPALANRPTFRWGVNAGSNYLITTSNTYFNLENVILDGNRANFTNPACISMSGANHRFRRVKFMGFTANQVITFANASEYIDCEVTDCTNLFGNPGGNPWMLDSCYIHDNSSGAITSFSTGDHKIFNCIFDSNGAAPITISSTGRIDIANCVFYGNTGPGVDITAAPAWVRFTNCIFVGNSTYGIALAGAYQNVYLDNCAFFGNTSGEYTSGNIAAANIRNKITLTADPFVDAANGDFRLNMNAGGGALLRGAGYPTTFPGAGFDTHRDIGAAQHTGRRHGDLDG